MTVFELDIRSFIHFQPQGYSEVNGPYLMYIAYLVVPVTALLICGLLIAKVISHALGNLSSSSNLVMKVRNGS